MPAFPTKSTLFTGTPSPANAKTWFDAFFDAVTGLTGTSGTAASARETMNIPLTNWLLNPDGAVYQQAVAATADDAYMDDCWYALTQTGSITPSQVSNPEDGYRYALRLTQSQASAQRMGRAQIIEGKDAVKLRGKAVTFGGRIKMSTSANVRMAILAWTGTEDVVTSDVVNTWTSSSYTTGNFFTSATLTVVASTSTAVTASTAANVSVSGTIPSNANNIIVFYWTEATAAQNVTLDAWGLRLVEASTLVDYVKRAFDAELGLARRFYEKSYEYGVAPGTAAAYGGAESGRRASESETTTPFGAKFKVTKRTTPTVTWYNPETGSAGSLRNGTSGTNHAVSGVSGLDPLSVERPGCPVYSAGAANAAAFMIGHWVADARL